MLVSHVHPEIQNSFVNISDTLDLFKVNFYFAPMVHHHQTTTIWENSLGSLFPSIMAEQFQVTCC